MSKNKYAAHAALIGGRACVEPGCLRDAGPTSVYCDDHRKGQYRCIVTGCNRSTKGTNIYCPDHIGGKGGKQTTVVVNGASNQSAWQYEDRHDHKGEVFAAVEVDGVTIEFGGAQKDRLIPKLHFNPQTLIINCLGVPIKSRPVIVARPKRLTRELVGLELNPEELCLDIEDREAPRLDPAFWTLLREGIIKARYTKVIACCFGGHGRTGTVLACLMLVFGVVATSEEAIAYVRKHHCQRSVESKAQEQYVKAVERATAR